MGRVVVYADASLILKPRSGTNFVPEIKLLYSVR